MIRFRGIVAAAFAAEFDPVELSGFSPEGDVIDASGGAPWQLRAVAGKAMRFAKRYESEALRAVYAFRRRAVIARFKALAAWYDATVDVDIAPDVRFGRDIGIVVWPGSNNAVRIGPGSVIGDRVLFRLNNATIDFADDVEVRRDSIIWMWGGTLTLAGENILSWGNVIHCASSITLGRQAATNEWVTIVDSSHYFTEPDRFFYHNTKTSPIEIGRNTWICSKSTIARGARVGDHCIIGGNSIVVGDVPSGHLASGVPATVIRPVPRPWIDELSAAARSDPERPPKRRAGTGTARPRTRSPRRTDPATSAGDGEALSPGP